LTQNRVMVTRRGREKSRDRGDPKLLQKGEGGTRNDLTFRKKGTLTSALSLKDRTKMHGGLGREREEDSQTKQTREKRGRVVVFKKKESGD